VNLPYPAILAVLAVTLAAATWAISDLAAGWEQRRKLQGRTMLDDAERRADSYRGRFDSWLRRTELGRLIAKRLTAANMRMSVSTFLFLMLVGFAGALYLIGTYIAPVFGVAAGAVVIFLFFAFLRRQEARRREAFIAQLPELARVLSNASAAGLVMRTAIEMAAEELDDPASTELRRTADSLRLGQATEQALQELGERLPSRELAVLVSTLIVSARSGGSLVTALRSIATTLEDRKEIRREVKTIMGEAIVTNWAIGIMGVGILVVVNLVSPGVLRTMSEHLLGQVILGVSSGVFILSLLIIRRITRIDV
jgi:tight adherence protein B